MACWRRTRTKSGKYVPRALWSQFYMSQGRLYVPREVDLADKTRGAQRPESCPPGQPYFKHRSSPWARPVRQGFCPRPPPAGQYVIYTPLTVYRISGISLKGDPSSHSETPVVPLPWYLSGACDRMFMHIYTSLGQYRIFMHLYVPWDI